ncbi:MAG: multiheme c-type cytochrome [Verrucomicrobia bacterium]|nr:multiheme c-type cytochrome [Verrucomicrobiota bacterium]
MLRKSLINLFTGFFFLHPAQVMGEVAGEVALMNKILGNASCGTSGCHGGAGAVGGVGERFKSRDGHARAFATLASARSARMGEVLGLADVTASASCTVCHAPAAGVPELMRGGDLLVADGVGCASCHESTDSWLRTHTRPELSHAEKVASGMRDLRSPLARAEACVACHQVIESRLVEQGRHPRLIFELDGQLASEPRHWREVHGWDGAKAWFVGQAVAWREAAAARASGRDTLAGVDERERALAWLVRRAAGATGLGAGALDVAGGEADGLARAAEAGWKTADGERVLYALAGCAAEFTAEEVSVREQAYRAERLVLALDRLLAAWPERARANGAGPQLANLFAAAQSVPDFEPQKFAGLMAEFARVLSR